MEAINGVVHIMNKLYFKAILEAEEYNDFGSIREKLIHEFFDDDLDTDDLIELLNMVDDVHVKFLSEQMPVNKEKIDNFRQLIFKVIEQKTKK